MRRSNTSSRLDSDKSKMSAAKATSPSDTSSISNLPPLIVGGAVFNTQYDSNPEKLPIKDILVRAFTHGLNALDTSPYYGPSEVLIGQALAQIRPQWPRDSYFICTKVGRIGLDDFDYSRAWVRKSVLRSLERLHTDYVDLVYMHDIEFVAEEQVYDALQELVQLKKEGLVRNIGVSGYPVDYLLHVAQLCHKNSNIGSLDAVLSYSNGCIQNTKLFELYGSFVECGIRKIMNGSILSMSLLRSGITQSFHPAPKALKDRVDEIAQKLLLEKIELADLATRFALKRWLFQIGNQGRGLVWNTKNLVVLGVTSLGELQAALDAYEAVQADNSEDEALFERVKAELGPEHYDETWLSGRF